MEPREPTEIEGGRVLRGPGHEPGGPAEIGVPIETAEGNGQPSFSAPEAHDWPWNRHDETSREAPPHRAASAEPQGEPRIDAREEPPRSSQQIAELGLPTAEAASVPTAVDGGSTTPAPESEKVAPKGPPRRGWWRRLTE